MFHLEKIIKNKLPRPFRVSNPQTKVSDKRSV